MQINPQSVYDVIQYVRNAPLPSQTEIAHSVVVPLATYSPWFSDEAFMATFERIKNHTFVDIYRCFELWDLVKKTRDVPGDLLEVGTWKGGTAAVIGRAAGAGKLYLADTFKGVTKAGALDPYYKGGEHADTTTASVHRLVTAEGVSDYEVLVGIFPDDAAPDTTFRFCHIDVDTYGSAKGAFDWVWPRMNSGGVVVFDDYGFLQCEGVTRFVNTIDAFKIHNLNGHAIVYKR